MIIQVETAEVDDLQAACREFVNLAYRWGEEASPGPPPSALGTTRPLAAATVLFPSGPLISRNPAERVRRRRRARELLEEAQYLHDHRITAWLVSASRTVELYTLTPDELIDLAAEDR